MKIKERSVFSPNNAAVLKILLFIPGASVPLHMDLVHRHGRTGMLAGTQCGIPGIATGMPLVATGGESF